MDGGTDGSAVGLGGAPPGKYDALRRLSSRLPNHPSPPLHASPSDHRLPASARRPRRAATTMLQHPRPDLVRSWNGGCRRLHRRRCLSLLVQSSAVRQKLADISEERRGGKGG